MPEPAPLVVAGPSGLYCRAGDFHIDPWKPVDRAVVTHAHSDHATPGCGRYLTSATGRPVLARRVQAGAPIEGLGFGEETRLNGVKVSLHPAGHLLGSAQVRVEHHGRVEVVSGDYKAAADPTCEAFEPVRCHRFVTESTFGLPIYRWPDPAAVAADMAAWWADNRAAGRTSIVFAYALGKAQRVLAMLAEAEAADESATVFAHGSVLNFVEVYRAAGVALPPVQRATPELARKHRGSALLVAPPSVLGTPWLKRWAPFSTSFASGWMMVRGNRRRRGVDRGFVVSDHVDWPGLMNSIDATGADSIGVTHGSSEAVVRYLREVRGLDADVVPTRWVGEDPAQGGASPASPASNDIAMRTAPEPNGPDKPRPSAQGGLFE